MNRLKERKKLNNWKKRKKNKEGKARNEGKREKEGRGVFAHLFFYWNIIRHTWQKRKKKKKGGKKNQKTKKVKKEEKQRWVGKRWGRCDRRLAEFFSRRERKKKRKVSEKERKIHSSHRTIIRTPIKLWESSFFSILFLSFWATAHGSSCYCDVFIKKRLVLLKFESAFFFSFFLFLFPFFRRLNSRVFRLLPEQVPTSSLSFLSEWFFPRGCSSDLGLQKSRIGTSDPICLRTRFSSHRFPHKRQKNNSRWNREAQWVDLICFSTWRRSKIHPLKYWMWIFEFLFWEKEREKKIFETWASHNVLKIEFHRIDAVPMTFRPSEFLHSHVLNTKSLSTSKNTHFRVELFRKSRKKRKSIRNDYLFPLFCFLLLHLKREDFRLSPWSRRFGGKHWFKRSSQIQKLNCSIGWTISDQIFMNMNTKNGTRMSQTTSNLLSFFQVINVHCWKEKKRKDFLQFSLKGNSITYE